MDSQDPEEKKRKKRKSDDRRRQRGQDRRRANLGKGPDGLDRRRNPGDRRRVLGDRRTNAKRPSGNEPAKYELRVDDEDNWDQWVRDLGDQKPSS